VSTGHGDIPWEDAFRALASIGYDGPVSIEWEDAGMDRLHGAAEAIQYVRSLLWELPVSSFDAAFKVQ
jgi:sugar phosphate isomerase/epimerase